MLNAVAATDPLGLYNANMGIHAISGGIVPASGVTRPGRRPGRHWLRLVVCGLPLLLLLSTTMIGIVVPLWLYVVVLVWCLMVMPSVMGFGRRGEETTGAEAVNRPRGRGSPGRESQRID